ncbi:HDOD domain-containing protein [Ramlibacter sp. AN1015]|uniref:EAL and HDOD domain-containing protein n=1 Tax=Ramlibacter sp. AN1015 TaxID=3133428 RepID=UPI0030C169B6
MQSSQARPTPEPPVFPDEPTGGVAVARAPILDRRKTIFGYELIDRSGMAPGPARDAEMLVQALSLADHHATAERRALMVPCHPATVSSGHLDLVDPARVVLEITLPTGVAAAAVAAAAESLRGLRQRGFRIAFSPEALASPLQGCLEHASFLKIDFSRVPAAQLPALLKTARARPGLRLIACGIETLQQQRYAADLGLELFQGSWYCRPLALRSHGVRPSQAVVLELVGLLRREASPVEIEGVLKRDPALSFNLLRYLNSPGVGLMVEVTSFRHAVMMLGMKKLLRWACLLMATARDGASPAVGQTAVIRGRLMELLASEMLPRDECDNAFVAGVFSLLDAMTGVALDRALEGLLLPDAIIEALLHRRGMLAPFLDLTEACEVGDEEGFARAANALSLSNHQVNMAHLQALAWAEDLLA